MQIKNLHVGYCTNVHPGETPLELEAILEHDVAAVKRRICPDAPFGTGLRIGATAAEQLLSNPSELDRMVALLEAQDLYVFTVNGFPYGDFGAAEVKAHVYEPSWLAAERIEYTLGLAQVVARLPGPDMRTISTVSGCFRPHANDPDTREAMASNLRLVAEGLSRIADDTGVYIRLCLEPEPWTTLETTDDTIRFFDAYLRAPDGAVLDHLGICYDCCHQAVHFEDPAQSIEALVDARVPIGKIQVSSALILDTPSDPQARRKLLRYSEPRYLHQVVGRQQDGTLIRAVDLPDLALPSEAWMSAESWRCHFHVPIWWAGAGVLSTTQADWQSAVRAALARDATTHLEVETYTWHVLPKADQGRLQDGSLHTCVAEELRVLLAAIEAG